MRSDPSKDLSEPKQTWKEKSLCRSPHAEKRRNRFIIWGVTWSFLFALISFYWASGGLWGAKTLGGEIYRQALARKPDFVLLLWLTGVAKVCGGTFLLWVKHVNQCTLRKILSVTSMAAGCLLFMYGFLNWISIFLFLSHLYSLSIEPYAAWWRLLFWEPFWMLGGFLYFASGRQDAVQNDPG